MFERATLVEAFSATSADDLWRLRGRLLQAGLPGDLPLWRLLDRFHLFLDELATSTSSREYSELASKLDVAAVGGIALEQLLEDKDPADLALGLLTGLISEGLMVLATRQHVHAWEGELDGTYRRAAWQLYGEIWRWSEAKKPELASVDRRRLVDSLFAPLRTAETAGFSKALLLALLFQLLLVSHLADALPS